jgi:siderophore synthetase component
MSALPETLEQVSQADCICRRVVDALLRENVREIVSRGRLVGSGLTPFPPFPEGGRSKQWLVADHLGDGSLWIPVRRQGLLQEWSLDELPLILQRDGRYGRLFDVADILAWFRQGLDKEASALFADFETECRVAIEHGVLCEAEKRRYFTELRAAAKWPADSPSWSERQLYYERLASFLDHPFYPTARAKLGFEAADLSAYGPEFQRPFRLRWLAVAKDLCCSVDHPGTEAWWPSFAEVGLADRLAGDYALLPVHPFLWNRQLGSLLDEHGLRSKVIAAPKSHVSVLPTLSVRTVVVREEPGTHIKLPLTIRTLGGKNIRTIKPSTIADGHTVQTLLGRIAEREPWLAGQVLLTDESRGAHVDHLPFLGYILRRYSAELEHATLLPVAALAAATSDGRLVAEEVAERFFDGRLEDFLNAYWDLTLRLHLLLWLRYGIALESNQQNSMLVLSREAPRFRLLLKDNDAPRIHGGMLKERWPELGKFVERLQDRRIVVDNELALAQMFLTITLQLNIAAPLEGLAATGRCKAGELYAGVRGKLEAILSKLEKHGEDARLARRILLEDDRHYLKYLLTAASLQTKQATGAADVNKFYGKTAPNFLKGSP